ncbi:hypothetical protein XELAEV_18021046mg [Xenopus laevis]|uniref:Uncharacterized protein n=1 Tax=Xenopus laevis TaxID=8355 RepID=A0A974HRJ1_XENLA|nr:hypothetical protein XELAEV_18021046mg [Xenopus laevis]
MEGAALTTQVQKTNSKTILSISPLPWGTSMVNPTLAQSLPEHSPILNPRWTKKVTVWSLSPRALKLSPGCSTCPKVSLPLDKAVAHM